MKKVLAVASLALLCISCSDPFGACVKANADIGQAISGGLSTVTNLAQSGTITHAEALNVAGYLEYANQADEAFGTCAQEAHTAGSKKGAFTACAQAFNASLNNPTELALIKVSNSQASQNIQLTITAVLSATISLIAALGGS